MPRTYPPHPMVGVGAVVWRENKVLIVRRGKPPRQGSWTLPGGAQHVGETVAQAACRELREEAGIEISVLDVAAVVDLIDYDDHGGVRYHYTVIDLVAEWISGEAVAGDDAEAVAWVAVDALDDYGVSEQAKQVVHEAGLKRALLGRHAP